MKMLNPSPSTLKGADVSPAVRLVLSGDNQGRSLESSPSPSPPLCLSVSPHAEVVTLSPGPLKLLINSSLKCCSRLPLSLSLIGWTGCLAGRSLSLICCGNIN